MVCHILYTLPVQVTSYFTGENKPFYSIYPVTIRNAGCYYCQVKNQHGKMNSTTATVFVLQTPKTPSKALGFSYSLVEKFPNMVSSEGLATSQRNFIPSDLKS